MQAFGQVFLDFDQGPLDRALEALHTGGAMAFDDDALQAEETCAIMSRRPPGRP